MELSKQVTSLELSKRLKEMGVKQIAAFNWFPNFTFQKEKDKTPTKEWILRRGGVIPTDSCAAFTVAELGEILPWDIVIQRSIQKDWILTYKPNGRHEGGVTGFQGVREAETRGRMLEYLIKNNLLSV